MEKGTGDVDIENEFYNCCHEKYYFHMPDASSSVFMLWGGRKVHA